MIVAILILFFMQILLISAKTAGFVNILIMRSIIAINTILMVALCLDYLQLRFHPTYIIVLMSATIVFFVIPHIVKHIYQQVKRLEKRKVLLNQKLLLRQRRELVEFSER